jgi:hypothetical protein
LIWPSRLTGEQIDWRITVLPSQSESLTRESFRRATTQLAAVSSLQVTATPSEFRVDDHAFFRADLQRATGARYYTTVVQTLAGDYLLHIELFAACKGELEQVASALQAITISDDIR